jgi:hypothetical protein
MAELIKQKELILSMLQKVFASDCEPFKGIPELFVKAMLMKCARFFFSFEGGKQEFYYGPVESSLK